MPLGTVSELGVSKLKVKLLSGRNIKQGNKLFESSIVCSFRFLNETEGTLSAEGMESFKTHPKRPDSTFLTTWNEMITLSPILSTDTVLHVRVFEYHLLKDIFICELFYSLHGLFAHLHEKDFKG